ncbi:LOW QUALITY PROTEIN: DNA mismatch repair protein Msh6-like [Tachypleus tridentatus]|uniref:LOW QUALITY PROTEIN: DNA mismatch repair protein Msh6-like n=1 Tax=Tachypleus tridentatus TaxID=6853 RepID=UPI003FD61881
MSKARENTLFKYFTKSPVSNVKSQENKKSVSKKKSNITKEQESVRPLGETRTVHGNIDCPFTLYEVVWAKLEGYPWWPSLVCNHPKDHVCVRPGKIPQIHVQFFDNPPTRAWVKMKFVKKFISGNQPDIPSRKDPVWKDSVEKAEKALPMKPDKRVDLVVCMESSDEEMTDEKLEENGVMLESMEENLNTESSDNSSDQRVRKRRRIIIESESEDSVDEFRPNDKDESDSDSISSGVDENEISEPEPESEELSPVKNTNRKAKRRRVENTSTIEKSPRTPVSVSNQTKAKLASFSASKTPSKPSEPDGEAKLWAHLKLDFLKDGKRRDIEGRPQSHPDYDLKTLFVPESFKKTLTPASRQWWEMKSQHFDTILFFKVGKFYELYHMDAVIGVNELGLIYMKGDFAHCGFPEIAYARYSDALIQKNYKVARVEQTETPQMMEERCKQLVKPSKFDRVVRREICRITTKGTRTYNVQDGEPSTAGHSYLLAVTEKNHGLKPGDESEYGVCFVDTSIGKFSLGQFLDDRHCSRLRTLIAHFPPVQVLCEKGIISNRTQKILKGCISSSLLEALKPGSEFWEDSKTLKFLIENEYFKTECGVSWPGAIRKMIDDSDTLQQTAKEEYYLAVKSLGACIWYLQESCVHNEILTLKKFEEYTPLDTAASPANESFLHFQRMVLDGVTLRNLEILENMSGTVEGSLLQVMDHCNTQFGKRLFHQWLCSPLCNPSSINDRLNAVEDWRGLPEVRTEVIKILKKLPDLERLISKIHTQGSAHRSKSHPDSRAIFYEAETYSKRKITDFLSALHGFQVALEIPDVFRKVRDNCRSETLKQCVTSVLEDGRFPDLKDTLDFFDNAFDHEKAKKDGKIIPSKGVDEDYDSAVTTINDTKKQLDEYLEKQKKHFMCKVTYFGSGKTRYQLEVPDSAVKHATDHYELQSQKKGYKRYWTPEVKNLLAKLINAEECRDAALQDIMRRIFATFDTHYEKWESAVQCLAVLDCLLSLAEYSLSCVGEICRPEVLIPDIPYQPFLEISQGRHPTLAHLFSGCDFIPNDVNIGIKQQQEEADSDEHTSSLMLVTGPNMGGKSTLMRQTGLIIIMAQMGSFVPAARCRFTPADRVFTRLGASDRIMAGESTFFVELSETSSILQHATYHSLVLLDELGRGTSTYDGSAIATAVVHDLSSRVQCRTLFSTHYHCLVDEFLNNPNVRLGHMACMVEDENLEDVTKETITFLYKFVDGACPKSYGFNAARLAGLPIEIIKKGHQKAREFEASLECRKMFRKLLSCTDIDTLKNCVEACT